MVVFCDFVCSATRSRCPGPALWIAGRTIHRFAVFLYRFSPTHHSRHISGKPRRSPALRLIRTSNLFLWTANNSLAFAPTNGHSRIISQRPGPGRQLSSFQILAVMQPWSSRAPEENHPPRRRFRSSRGVSPRTIKMSWGNGVWLLSIASWVHSVMWQRPLVWSLSRFYILR